jgi:hypothetical protein
MRGLEFLIGEMSGVERVSGSSWTEAYTAHAVVVGTGLFDQATVQQRQEQRRDGNLVFEALNIFQVSPDTGDTLLFSFDSFGFPPEPPARGGWTDGTLVLDRATARGASRTTFTPTVSGYVWAKHFRSPGSDEWTEVISGSMNRLRVTQPSDT